MRWFSFFESCDFYATELHALRMILETYLEARGRAEEEAPCQRRPGRPKHSPRRRWWPAAKQRRRRSSGLSRPVAPRDTSGVGPALVTGGGGTGTGVRWLGTGRTGCGKPRLQGRRGNGDRGLGTGVRRDGIPRAQELQAAGRQGAASPGPRCCRETPSGPGGAGAGAGRNVKVDGVMARVAGAQATEGK